MTARKATRTRRPAPPGWYHLQDAARMFGISATTMTGWVRLGFVATGNPDGKRALVSGDEITRVRAWLEDQHR